MILLDPCYPELNKSCFAQRMNHYTKMVRWLVVVNIVVWLTVTNVVIKSMLI
jgi:hypothetical protein